MYKPLLQKFRSTLDCDVSHLGNLPRFAITLVDSVKARTVNVPSSECSDVVDRL